MSVYTYSVSTDFPNAVVDAPKLITEIGDSSIGTKPTSVTVDGDVCTVEFATSINQPDLDAVVAAHDGQPVIIPKLHEAVLIVPGKKLVTELAFGEAAEMGGSVTTPQFFVPNLAKVLGQCTGRIQSDGDVEMRIMEDGVTAISAVYTHPSTGGAWEVFQVQTNAAPSAGTHEYTLEARLNGAVVAELKNVAMALLELP